MLAELAQVARKERADLLAYLLEMAFTEASDLLTDRSLRRHQPISSETSPPA